MIEPAQAPTRGQTEVWERESDDRQKSQRSRPASRHGGGVRRPLMSTSRVDATLRAKVPCDKEKVYTQGSCHGWLRSGGFVALAAGGFRSAFVEFRSPRCLLEWGV